MIKNLITAVTGFFLAVSLTQANAIVWEVSPDSNSQSFLNTVVVGNDGINVNATASQDIGIFGAGFTVGSVGTGSVSFDADLGTWDAYNANTGNGTGYWDAFVVMISSEGYYWDLAADPLWSDPVAANDSTFVWGGDSYADDTFETYLSFDEQVTALGTGTWYVSFVLDTATLPDSDHNYASAGSFHVTSVPEPGTLLLLGGGLLGLTFTGRRKRNNS